MSHPIASVLNMTAYDMTPLNLSMANDSTIDDVLATQSMRALERVAEARLLEHGFDPGHDLHHCHRVAKLTFRLDPKLVPAEIVAAALLHDVVNLPKDHPDRSKASSMSADFAREVLPEFAFEKSSIERIARAIESHSYSAQKVPGSDLGRALQDADRLETLGHIGILRVFSTGSRMGAAYFDRHDPWAESRPLDDKRYSFDHFQTKLFRLPNTMCTEAGRAEAQRRVERMKRFLAELSEELFF